MRHGLNGDLGFSDEDRVENIRRIGEMAKLFADAGIIVLSAFISPFRADSARFGRKNEFIEVFMDTPLNECEQRDPKGLYQKARAGKIKNFTGIDSEYEVPSAPEINIRTTESSVEQCLDQIIEYLKDNNMIFSN